MKKLFIFAMGALLAACSADDDSMSERTLPNDEVEIDLAALTSDIPIEFGVVDADAYVTRGSIDETNMTDIPDIRVLKCISTRRKTGSRMVSLPFTPLQIPSSTLRAALSPSLPWMAMTMCSVPKPTILR